MLAHIELPSLHKSYSSVKVQIKWNKSFKNYIIIQNQLSYNFVKTIFFIVYKLVTKHPKFSKKQIVDINLALQASLLLLFRPNCEQQ